MQTGGVLAVAHIDPQAGIPIHLINGKAIPVLQSKQGVHQAEVRINVRHRQCQWRNTKSISQGSSQISLWRSRSSLVLRQPDIGGLFREAQQHTKIFLCHAPHCAEKVDSFTDCHNCQLHFDYRCNQYSKYV